MSDQESEEEDSSGAETSTGRPDTSRRAGRIMAFGAWMIVLVFGTITAQRALDARSAAKKPVIGSAADGSPTLTLSADRYGHFSVDTTINGEPVTFLVDTGATGIALPAAAAERLELKRGRSFNVTTAAGPAVAWRTQLDSLRVGPFEEQNVAASISPEMEGEVGLLGMSFLRHFELLQRDGELLIRRP